FLPRERWHLWMIDARTGRARQLTEGDTFDELAPTWSPDGQSIAFLSNHAPDPDLDPDAVDLFVMPAAGGEPRRIETPLGGKELPAFSPDGQWIAYYATEGRGNWWQNTNLWVVPADGSAPARNLTVPFDLHVSASTINDVGAAVQPPPVWSPDSRTLYFQVARHGSTRLYAVEVDGGKPYEIINKPGVVADFSLDRAGQTLACRLGTMTDPGPSWAYPLDGRRPRRHTTFNRAVVRRAEACPIEEVWFKGAAGNDLQGWILKPPNFDPDKTYPSILDIHGGPYTQYGHFFMHEFFFLAGQGYVVYFCNPRGGQGYGEAHAKATWHDQGGADYDDLMCWTDYLAQQPYIDPNRMGVTGGSYGGFMTLWIIGHTDRFKAAVAQRVVSNEISMHGTSDFNWVFQYPMGDKPPWEDLENTWRLSPMKYIGNVKTPTLIIHSEQDHRCPIEQGEQAFVALKQLGVETEMVRFPDEPHGLSRVGRTDRRIARLNHILRWFDKYLKADGS
ncbi:MAG: S9 family peptidase, partial [Caldilineae bacterium]